ncbi:hypothetical protein G4D82_10300 [Flavobacterium sp. CYK-4]|uniref:HNH endonuclease n=1 Tax=Flavobacterium lotistagni TaxID=2709660 RepID=UPI001408C17C|nr:HNH endonuclease [Flavobacterium lotistagni]NHM07613.1 hypothetical protein [Flavobacterium lotistagni]
MKLSPKRMSKPLFRESAPVRSYTGPILNPYQKYKTFLVDDFNKRCGYTNCHHIWFGGKQCFHIDHVKPKSKNPELLNDYKNLVYSCSYVNMAKGDDDNDYLDPVNDDYNLHFYRDEHGNIYPNADSPRANYMYTKLKLYLGRYQIIFMLDKLRDKMNEVKNLIESLEDGEDKTRLKLVQSDLASEFLNYLNYLEVGQ